MGIPAIPTRHQDETAHRQVISERINQIRNFDFDDSRVRTLAEIAASVTPVNYAYAPGHVFRYMTSAQIADVLAFTKLIDVRAAVQAAINVCSTAGGTVYAPAGGYLIESTTGDSEIDNGLHIPYTDVFGNDTQIVFEGDGHSTIFYAGTNDMVVIRLSDSHCRLRQFAIDANAKTGCWGLALVGSDLADVTLAEHVDWNTVSNISIRGFVEGLVMESPSSGGCYYNRLEFIRSYDNTRHIYLRDNADSGSGPNRNVFFGCSMNGGNTGVDIDGTDTCVFIFCAFETISTGTSPAATPTAFRTNSVGSLSSHNTADHVLVGCQAEGCTRDLDIGNRRITIIGGTMGTVGAIAGAATADLHLGGDASYRLRELFIGDKTADGLSLDDRISALTTYSNCAVFTSANAAGAYPFDNDGSLVLKSRSQAASGVSIVTGSTPAERFRADGAGHCNFLLTDLGLTQSTSSVQTLDNGTIATAGVIVTRINPQGNRTGVILESGSQPGQLCVVVNENSSFSVTFAASGTSHVADGTGSSVAALRAAKFIWDSSTSLWYRA